MISETESFRTKISNDEYYMIMDEIVNDNCWTFSSDTSLMKPEETDLFLQNSGVI